jgi:hypothetical protein
MADRKISDLTALTTPASGDFLPIVDISEAAAASKNKRITIEELMRGVPDGTAAAPGIAFETYPSTGVYSSGANQLAIATNGTGRLFIDASGRVGVGLASTGSTFRSTGLTGVSIIEAFGADADGFADLEIKSNGASGASRLYFSDTAAQSGLIRYSHNTNSLEFTTAGSERLRITSGGLVGIGTSSVNALLEVNSSTAGNEVQRIEGAYSGSGSVTLTNWRRAGGAVAAAFKYNDGTSPLCMSIGTTTSHQFRIRTADTDAITIDTSQRVGIGTTIPLEKLEIQDGLISVGSSANTSQANTLIAGYGYILSGTKYGNTSIRSTYNNANNLSSLEFYTSSSATASTERARIDSSGRLLVGTSTSPSAGSGQYSMLVVQGYQGAPTDQGDLSIQRGEAATAMSSGDELGYIKFNDSVGNSFAYISAVADAAPGTNDYPGRLVFSTTVAGASSPTERMRIGQSGALDAYSTPADAGISARVSYGAGTTYGFFSGKYSASSTATGTNSFYVYTNGNVVNTNNSYGALSDIKLKENIVDANSQWGDLKALQVRNYNFKEGQTHTQIGLVAQEAELVSPGLVTESPDRDAEGNDLGTVTKSVNYSVLYMKAVKALQEAMERIEALEADVAQLKGA